MSLPESFDPSRPDFSPYGFTCVRWAPTRMGRPDRHNEIELNFLETGWVTYLFGGRTVRVGAGQLTVFWAAIPHQIVEHGGGTKYFVATLPLAWFLQRQLPEPFVHAMLRGECVCAPGTERAAGDAARFRDWERDFRQPLPGFRRSALLEIEARLIRLAWVAPPVVPADPAEPGRRLPLAAGGLDKVEKMACLIARRYTERLTVEEIARSVSLHPNYVMTLFHRAFGTTLINYVTQHRVSHAQRLLVTTDLKVVDIAESAGFGSVSRFNDAFRRACGCSPRDYRREHFLPDPARSRTGRRRLRGGRT